MRHAIESVRYAIRKILAPERVHHKNMAEGGFLGAEDVSAQIRHGRVVGIIGKKRSREKYSAERFESDQQFLPKGKMRSMAALRVPRGR